eukprot:gene7053-7267_t
MQRFQSVARHLGGDSAPSELQLVRREPTRAETADRAPLVRDRTEYERLYKWSIEDPQDFWAHMAHDYYWAKKWEPNHHHYNFDMNKGPISVTWFKGGKTNLCYNCLDRWVAAGRGNQVAFLWEGNDYGHERAMTYQQVLDETCRLANWLRGQGVRKGDCVTIYLPMICELPIAMLACARIGAVHSVVFAGFSADALAQRVQDGKSRVVITASAVNRGPKRVDLKAIVDEAAIKAAANGYRDLQKVLVFEKSALPREMTPWTPGRDVWWHKEIPQRPDYCEVEWLDAEEPSFMLYTSGSTGQPKGVLHTIGGYMVGAGATCKYLFDLRPGDVRVLYTAPTLIRSLMQFGDNFVTDHDRSSLRILGTVGEPINPHAWEWYHHVVGEDRCPIIDTWWQTETGTALITPLPHAWEAKPGSATLPFFGVQPVLLTDKGVEIQGPGEGILAIKAPWPSMMRTVYGDHARFEQTYFSAFKGYYFTGDGCRRDADGFYWITGRVDDVINVSGHRVGTAEVESALTMHDLCTEAAVIGVPHPVKGESIYAYVTLLDDAQPSAKLHAELINLVKTQIGSFAAPDVIHWAPGLPKTRSGKIMRRILRKIAADQLDQLGDTSTLADPLVVDQLIASRPKVLAKL